MQGWHSVGMAKLAELLQHQGPGAAQLHNASQIERARERERVGGEGPFLNIWDYWEHPRYIFLLAASCAYLDRVRVHVWSCYEGEISCCILINQLATLGTVTCLRWIWETALLLYLHMFVTPGKSLSARCVVQIEVSSTYGECGLFFSIESFFTNLSSKTRREYIPFIASLT